MERSGLSAEQRIALVIESLRGGETLQQICQHAQISPELLNAWRQKFVNAGKKALARGEISADSTGKKLTADDKVSIVLKGMQARANASDICRSSYISTKQFQEWREKLLEAGKKALTPSAPLSGKNLLAVAAVVVVVAVAITLGVLRVRGQQGPPEAVLKEMVKMMDYKTLESVSLPRSEWEGLRDKTPKTNVYKNPKTGQYTLVDIFKCANCGKDIPAIAVTDELAVNGDFRKMRAEYVCPYCGKSPFFKQ
jgi:transposase-like protein/DNA-directed RNA polymerase subunit RPC12/RpoP